MTLPAGSAILEGSNGAGKTSLLEAIRLLSTLGPFRGRDEDAVRRAPEGPREGYRVAGGDVEVVFRRGPPTEKRARREGRPCERLSDAVGLVRTALFAPEDLRVVSGAPSERRRFLDVLAGQTDPAGFEALGRWRAVQRRRLAALRAFWLGTASAEAVRAWDAPAVTAAAEAETVRRGTAERLAPLLRRRGAEIMDAPLEATYRSGGPVRIAEGLRLEGGPTRDDLAMTLGGRDIRLFASQGERRGAALAMRLAEADLVAEGGDRPTILVDDVCGELDPRRRAAFLTAAADAGARVLLAATDAGPFREALPGATVIRIPGDLR